MWPGVFVLPQVIQRFHQLADVDFESDGQAQQGFGGGVEFAVFVAVDGVAGDACALGELVEGQCAVGAQSLNADAQCADVDGVQVGDGGHLFARHPLRLDAANSQVIDL